MPPAKPPKTFLNLPSLIVIKAIQLYQKTLSPDHSPLLKRFWPHGFCRFYPSCSEYGIQAIRKYGFWRGIWKTTGRVLRCNPWNQGGHDEP